MKIKTQIFQSLMLLVVTTLGSFLYIVTSDEQLNLTVINKTGASISMFALKYQSKYCSVTSLLVEENIKCALDNEGETSISVHGVINGEPYLIERIEGLKLGKSYRNLIYLKPNKTYEIKSKQVIN